LQEEAEAEVPDAGQWSSEAPAKGPRGVATSARDQPENRPAEPEPPEQPLEEGDEWETNPRDDRGRPPQRRVEGIAGHPGDSQASRATMNGSASSSACAAHDPDRSRRGSEMIPKCRGCAVVAVVAGALTSPAWADALIVGNQEPQPFQCAPQARCAPARRPPPGERATTARRVQRRIPATVLASVRNHRSPRDPMWRGEDLDGRPVHRAAGRNPAPGPPRRA